MELELQSDVSTSADSLERDIHALQGGAPTLATSLRPETFQDAVALTQAQMNATPVDDQVNSVLHLRHYIVQPVELVDDNGVLVRAPRVVLIADEGAFSGTSVGLLSALKNIVGILGDPNNWPESLPVKVVRKKSRNNAGSFFSLDIVSEPAKK